MDTAEDRRRGRRKGLKIATEIGRGSYGSVRAGVTALSLEASSLAYALFAAGADAPVFAGVQEIETFRALTMAQ